MSDDIEVKDGMLFEATELSRRPGDRFTVGQSPEYAAPLVRRWLALGTVRPVPPPSAAPMEAVEETIMAAIRNTQAAHRAATEARDEGLARDLLMAHAALERAMRRAQGGAMSPVQQTPPPPSSTLPR